MRWIIVFLAISGSSALHANDPVKEALVKKLKKLDQQYFKIKRKHLSDARDAFEKLKVAETKKGNLEKALHYKAKVAAMRQWPQQYSFRKRNSP